MYKVISKKNVKEIIHDMMTKLPEYESETSGYEELFSESLERYLNLMSVKDGYELIGVVENNWVFKSK